MHPFPRFSPLYVLRLLLPKQITTPPETQVENNRRHSGTRPHYVNVVLGVLLLLFFHGTASATLTETSPGSNLFYQSSYHGTYQEARQACIPVVLAAGKGNCNSYTLSKPYPMVWAGWLPFPGRRGSIFYQFYYDVSCPEGKTLDQDTGQCLGNPGPTLADEQKKKNDGKAPCDGERGNPCNPLNGNKHQTEKDYTGVDANVSIVRHYNSSRVEQPGNLGHGWTMGTLKHLDIYPDLITLIRGDGKGFPFIKENDAWVADKDIDLTLVETSDGFTITYTNGAQDLFNPTGQLLHVKDRSGRMTSYSRSDDKPEQLNTIKGPFGHTLAFDYDDADRINTITLPDMGEIHYGYDDKGNLDRVTYPDESFREYHYEDLNFPQHLTGISDEEGIHYAIFAYDDEGRAILSEHIGGKEKFTFAYDSATQSTITDAAGNVEVMEYNTVLGKNNLVRLTNHGDGKSLLRVYDENNNVILQTDGEGRTTTYDYNNHKQRISITRGAGTPESKTTEYQYLSDDLDLPTVIETPSLYPGQKKVVTIDYDNNNNPTITATSGYTPGGSPVSRTVTRTYNNRRQLIEIDGPRTDIDDITSFTYYDCETGGKCGQLKDVTNALGHVTRYEDYDANGRVARMVDSNGLVTGYDYDPRGRVLAVTWTGDSIAARSAGYEYDHNGRLVRATDPSGAEIFYGYNDAGEMVEVTDSLGNTVSYHYDERGNRKSETVTDTQGVIAREVSYIYDARNRSIQVNSGNSVFKKAFNSTGDLVSETDANENPATGHTFDSLGRLENTVNRLGDQTRYRYNSNDQIIDVEAPNAANTTYDYDDLGNLLRENSPDRGLTEYRYDAAGNMTQRTDARGVITTYSYDAMNRVTLVDYPGDEEDVHTHFDNCANGAGRLCSMTDQSGVTDYTYDLLGNVRSKVWTTDDVTYETHYGYDASNRMIAMTYPDGRTVNYKRDTLGRIISITHEYNNAITTLVENRDYRADSLLTQQLFGNGMEENRRYDLQGRLKWHMIGELERHYDYDANGNILEVLGPVQNSTYYYDALDRLITDQWHTDTRNDDQSFGYDANGNRTLNIDNGKTKDYAYEQQSNRLTLANNRTVILDETGNTLSDQDGKRRFTYNKANRLSEFYKKGRLRATYLYNGAGQRVSKTIHHRHDKKHGKDTRRPHKKTIYHYNLNGQLIAETTAKGELIKAYVWADQTPLVQIDRKHSKGIGHAYGKHKHDKRKGKHRKETISWLHTDHLDTPRFATNDEGEFIWQWSGSAFGDDKPRVIGKKHRADKLTDNRGKKDHSFINLRFPGQYYDAETELHYNYFRYYDTSTGRYITSDLIGLKGGLNTYGYVGGNPLFFTDPKGLLASTDALQHYMDGNGATLNVAMSQVGINGIRPSLFPQVQSQLPNGDCCIAKTVNIDDKKAFGTSGESAVTLGDVTFRLTGILTINNDCTWAFSGQLRAFDDVYDFNKSIHRGFAGELSTAIGAIIPGTPFSIHFVGGKRISESGP